MGDDPLLCGPRDTGAHVSAAQAARLSSHVRVTGGRTGDAPLLCGPRDPGAHISFPGRQSLLTCERIWELPPRGSFLSQVQGHDRSHPPTVPSPSLATSPRPPNPDSWDGAQAPCWALFLPRLLTSRGRVTAVTGSVLRVGTPRGSSQARPCSSRPGQEPGVRAALQWGAPSTGNEPPEIDGKLTVSERNSSYSNR